MNPTMEQPVMDMLRRRENRLSYTSTQAANYLGVSLGTVRRWADAGFVQCYRTPGGQRRFSRQQLDVFLASLTGHDEHQTPVASGF